MSDKESSWSSKPSKPKTETTGISEKRRGLISNAITVILTIAMMATGFSIPRIFADTMESDRDMITVLPISESDDFSQHVFDEPVSLYPWNLYNPEKTSDLNYSERGFLIDQRVPDFLIATMKTYGMDVSYLQLDSGRDPQEYASSLLIDAFVFLNTNEEANQGCYVINSLDINQDGTADLRCAVDQSGAVISLRFESDPWEIPEGFDDPDPETPDTETPTPGSETPAGEAASAADAATTPENAESNAPAGAEATESTPPEEVEGEPEDEPSPELDLSGLKQVPVGEELAIWSFAHRVVFSSEANNQYLLHEAVILLDSGFSNRYANPEDVKGNGQNYSPNPTVFATEEYALYIYDLPNDVRFIIYFDSDASRCVGFNLQA